MATIYIVCSASAPYPFPIHYVVGDAAVRAAALVWFRDWAAPGTFFEETALAEILAFAGIGGLFSAEMAALEESKKRLEDIEPLWCWGARRDKFKAEFAVRSSFKNAVEKKVFDRIPIPSLLKMMVNWGNSDDAVDWGWRSVIAIDENREITRYI